MASRKRFLLSAAKIGLWKDVNSVTFFLNEMISCPLAIDAVHLMSRVE